MVVSGLQKVSTSPSSLRFFQSTREAASLISSCGGITFTVCEIPEGAERFDGDIESPVRNTAVVKTFPNQGRRVFGKGTQFLLPAGDSARKFRWWQLFC